MITAWADHYWRVAGEEAQVYSSARRTFVSTRDAVYVAWLRDRNTPSLSNSQADLWDLLSSHYPAGVSDAGLSYARAGRMERLATDVEDETSDTAVFVRALIEALADSLPEAQRITAADVAAKVREKGTGIAHVR